MAVLTVSAYRPLVQCQPSINEAFEQLSQFSVINVRLWPSRRILRPGPRNLAKFSAESCGPYISLPSASKLIICLINPALLCDGAMAANQNCD